MCTRMSVWVCDSLCHIMSSIIFHFITSQITWASFSAYVHKLLALITIKHTIHRLCVILLLFRWECESPALQYLCFMYSSLFVFISRSLSLCVVSSVFFLFVFRFYPSSTISLVLIFQVNVFSMRSCCVY